MADTQTSRLHLVKAAGTSLIKVLEHINNAFDIVDDSIGIWDCTAATRPTTNLYNGKLIREVDTDNILRYNLPGLSWEVVSQGEWTTWVPTLIGSVTNPTLGVGGSSSGKYVIENHRCRGTAQFIFGTSGTNQGSGFYSFAPPVPVAVGHITPGLGHGRVVCGAALYSFVQLGVGGAGFTMYYYNAAFNGSPVNCGSAAPGAWTINNSLTCQFDYEIA